MAKKIIPFAFGAALGAAGAYAYKKAHDAERSARLPLSLFDKDLQPTGVAFRLDPLARDITPGKLRSAGKLSRRVKAPEMPDLRHHVETVRGRGGAFAVHVYAPLESVGHLPVVEWLHGGGFSMDTSALEMALIDRLMQDTPSIFVVPEYRLADQAAAPAAAEDAYDCLIWIKENLARIGGRSDQIFVGGIGAGGGLACAVTLMARDWGKVNIAFQMPLYPMLDDRMVTASSRNNDAPWWNTRANIEAWNLYLGDDRGTDAVTRYEAPARETDFTGLPPAYSFVGALDPLADETVAYFTQLRQAGADVTLDVYPGCYHAFDLVAPQAAISLTADNRLSAEFHRAVDTCFAGNE